MFLLRPTVEIRVAELVWGHEGKSEVFPFFFHHDLLPVAGTVEAGY